MALPFRIGSYKRNTGAEGIECLLPDKGTPLNGDKLRGEVLQPLADVAEIGPIGRQTLRQPFESR